MLLGPNDAVVEAQRIREFGGDNSSFASRPGSTSSLPIFTSRTANLVAATNRTRIQSAASLQNLAASSSSSCSMWLCTESGHPTANWCWS